MYLKAYRVPAWETESGLKHGFLARVGGNSQGAYAGLNVSFAVGDDTQAVKDNYCDMKQAVGMTGTRMVTMQQKHGDNVIRLLPRLAPQVLLLVQDRETNPKEIKSALNAPSCP